MVSVDYDHYKIKEISHLNNYIDSVASKTIYALHLIDGDNTVDAPGIDCEITCPFTIEILRLENIEQEEIYSRFPEITFFMHVMIQYWSA